MSPSMSAWLGASADLVNPTPTDAEAERAAQAWRRIQDKPSSVTFKKPDGTTLSAQTVRLESDNSASLSESEAGATPRRKLIIFGVRGHDTVTDTDIAEGYRFVSGSDLYRVTDIILTLGEAQGVAEATG